MVPVTLSEEIEEILTSVTDPADIIDELSSPVNLLADTVSILESITAPSLI